MLFGTQQYTRLREYSETGAGPWCVRQLQGLPAEGEAPGKNVEVDPEFPERENI